MFFYIFVYFLYTDQLFWVRLKHLKSTKMFDYIPTKFDWTIFYQQWFHVFRIQKRLFGNRRERRRAMGELFHCHKTMSSIIVSLAPDRHREASSSSLKNTLIVIPGVFISKTLWSSYHYDRRDVYLKDTMAIKSLWSQSVQEGLCILFSLQVHRQFSILRFCSVQLDGPSENTNGITQHVTSSIIVT